MEITSEILEAFSAGKTGIREVRLTYKNGGKVLGIVRKLKLRPGKPDMFQKPGQPPKQGQSLKLVIDKQDPKEGERPLHRAVFDHVTALEVHYTNGTSVKFP
jgi:hypothetical protein